MKGLWIKDIRSLLKYKILFFCLTALMVIVYGMLEIENMLLFVGMTSSLVFITSVFCNDEQDGASSFLFTLPFTRKQYVQEKYMFGIVSLLFSTIFFSSLVILVRSVRTGLFSSLSLMEILMSLWVLCVFLAIHLFICFKFGVEKGRFILVGLLTSVCWLMAYILSEYEERYQIFFENIMRKKELYICLFTMIVIVILIISYIFSVKIVEKKEYS